MGKKKDYKWADFMSVETFKAQVQCGGFINYDGYGYLVKGDVVEDEEPGAIPWGPLPGPAIWPSRVKAGEVDFTGVTEIVWFNR